MPQESAAGADLFAGRFRLLGLLGSGGDASVYRAFDEHGDREIALKVMHPQADALASRADALASRADVFVARARQAAAVRHPNLVRVLSFGVDHADTPAGRPWMALELLPGETLRDVVDAGGVLPVADAVAVLTGVLAGLDALHRAGLVHRDVTPANVMIDQTPGAPRAVLLDLGLAAPRGEPALETVDPGEAVAAAGGTGTPRVRGTADWMSPEQLLGDPVDERADVYQSAALLYFALTARPPFVRDSVEAVQRAHLSAPPPVASVLNPRVPRSLDRVIAHAMLKSPDARPRSAAEFEHELRTALGPADRARRQPAEDAAPAPTALYPVPGTASRPTETVTPSSPVTRTAARPDAATVALPIAQRTSRPGDAAAARPSDRHAGRRTLLPIALLAAAVGLGAVWFATSSSDRPIAVAVAPSAASSAPAVPGPSVPVATTAAVEPPPPPSTVEVPVLAGAGGDGLAALLAERGLALGAVTMAPSSSPARTVLSSSPGEGAAVLPGAVVDVVVASGENAVPAVVGVDEATATVRVRDAGFAVQVTVVPAAGEGTAGRVVASYPSSGSLLTLGQTVTLVREAPQEVAPTPVEPPVATATPTPTPAPTPAPTTTPAASALASIRSPGPRLGKASFIVPSSRVHPGRPACGRDTGSEGKARR